MLLIKRNSSKIFIKRRLIILFQVFHVGLCFMGILSIMRSNSGVLAQDVNRVFKKKKVAIITGAMGYGHISIANKLHSHPSDMSAVAQCDILNMSDILSDYFISDERASKFASYVNSFIWGHYQTFSECPAILRRLHPLSLISRYSRNGYALVAATACDMVYNR